VGTPPIPFLVAHPTVGTQGGSSRQAGRQADGQGLRERASEGEELGFSRAGGGPPAKPASSHAGAVQASVLGGRAPRRAGPDEGGHEGHKTH